MTKIEEVARAIAEEEQHLGAWETYVRVATAALRAMEVPTQAMLDAGDEAINMGWSNGGMDDDTAAGTWQAMMDAMVKKP